MRLQTTISFYLFPNCHFKICFFFFLSPNLFERLSALVVQFIFQFDQVDTRPEANHLFWGQHWSVANWFPSQLSTEQTQHPTAYPTPYQSEHECLELCMLLQRTAQRCPAWPRSHFPRNISHKSSGGSFSEIHAVPLKIFMTFFFH